MQGLLRQFGSLRLSSVISPRTSTAAVSSRTLVSSIASSSASPLNRARLVQRAHTPRGLDEFFEDGRSLPLTSAQTGRAWLVSELRQKSFDDLHRLWIILLKERNLLASQRLEAKRYGVPITHYSNRSRVIKCKKTMRRIMTVLTERRIAYEEAFLKTKIKEALETGEISQEQAGQATLNEYEMERQRLKRKGIVPKRRRGIKGGRQFTKRY